jgi:hypothetical protein
MFIEGYQSFMVKDNKYSACSILTIIRLWKIDVAVHQGKFLASTISVVGTSLNF